MSQSPPTPGPGGTRVLNLEVESEEHYEVLMLVMKFGLNQIEAANDEVDGGDEVLLAARDLYEQADEKEPVWLP